MFKLCRYLLGATVLAVGIPAIGQETRQLEAPPGQVVPVELTPVKPVEIKKTIVAIPLIPVGESPSKETKPATPATPSQETTTLGGVILSIFGQSSQSSSESLNKVSTHQTTDTITVKSKDGKMGLQSIAIDSKDRILALVGPEKSYNGPVKNARSEVHVLDITGKTIEVWPLDFHATAINASPSGVIYVGGDSRIARFESNGKSLGVVMLPMIEEALNNKDKIRKQAEKNVEEMQKSMEVMRKNLKEQLAKLEAKKDEDLTKTERQLMKNLKMNLEYVAKGDNTPPVESQIQSILGRLRIINSVTSNDKEIYVVCGETEGYGFAVWRLDSNLKNPQKVLANVSGCCGQMDIQCCGSDLLVAENTKHRFARYDHAGKEVASGGQRGLETEPGCFGGCCNPMNVRLLGDDILTSEPEGIIKKFSADGKFISFLGKVPTSSNGCRNVAIAATRDGKTVFFGDPQGSRIAILKQKTEKEPVQK